MLRKAHRILGIITGPLILLWFISGMVMMYVSHPKAHRSALDRLPRMGPLVADDILLNFQQAWLKTGLSGSPVKARINMLIRRPAYFFQSKKGEWKVVYADTGDVLSSVTPDMAKQSASMYMGKDFSQSTVTPLDKPDQWTVGTGVAKGYPPFYKLKCKESPDTWVYVSRTTGEVCQVTTQKERCLAWLGSIPHWLYFTVLRQHLELWRQVIIWLAGAGTVAVLLGLWIGIANFRWKGYGRNRHLRSSVFIGVKKWHHFLGLAFGLTTLVWIFSGMLSLSPLHWHSETAPSLAEAQLMTGGHPKPSMFVVHPAEALNTSRRGNNVRKVDLLGFNGVPHYLLWESKSNSHLLRADEPGHPVMPHFSAEEISAVARQLVPGNEKASYTILHEYDLYYVDKKGQARLPVVKLDFYGADLTTYYISMHDGTIAKRYDRSARLNRWLYRFMHCFDIPFLIRHRLLRDGLMLFFLAGGTLLTAAGLYSWIRPHRSKRKAFKLQG